jgi:phage tail-like protein
VTGRAVTATAADWADWGGRNHAVVDGAAEIATERTVEASEQSGDLAALTSVDGTLVTLSSSGAVRLRDGVGRGRRLPDPGGTPVALCRRGDRLYVADGETGALTVYDTTFGRQIGTVETTLAGPTDIAAVDGSVYAIEGDRLRRLRSAGHAETISTGLGQATGLAGADDRLLLAGPDGIRTHPVGDASPTSTPDCSLSPRRVAAGDGRLVVAGSDGDGHGVAVIDDAGEWQRWQSVDGPVRALTVDSDGITVGTDGGCLSLSRTERYATPDDGDAPRAVVVGQFDAGVEGVQWHRLRLDATAPGPETCIRVFYRAADDPPARTTTVGDGGAWTAANGVDDCLLRSAHGRYLQVAVELLGCPSASPRVASVWASCPRKSMLRHLPDLYRSADADVLERLLAVFGGFFADVSRTRDASSGLFDPYGVPASSLGWLASWLGLDARPAWPTPARRERIDRANELARLRGTRRGLTESVGLLLSHLPGDQRSFVVEPADLPDGPASAPVEKRLDGERSVLVYAGPFERERDRELVGTAIDRETPAHVDATLVPLEPTTALGTRAFLDANSRLAPTGVRLDETAVGSGTLPAARADDGLLDTR